MKQLRVYVITAAVACATLTFVPGAHASDLWADNGRIIYISCEMSSCAPYTIRDDGTGEKPVLQDAEFEETPTISDNGKRVAFMRASDIYVAKIDGTGLDNVTETPGVTETEPDISPDGKSIVYTSFQNSSSGDIVRSDIDGGAPKPVVDTAKAERSPEWSPDGKRIVFARLGGSPSTSDVYSVRKDGSAKRQLTDTANKSEQNPTWSPNGERIAFSQSSDTGLRLKTIEADGGPMTTVKTEIMNPDVPSWSPSGKRLSFFGFDAGRSDVFTVKLDGTGERNITDDAAPDFFYD